MYLSEKSLRNTRFLDLGHHLLGPLKYITKVTVTFRNILKVINGFRLLSRFHSNTMEPRKSFKDRKNKDVRMSSLQQSFTCCLHKTLGTTISKF
jgi:hypothetical protein